MRKTSRGPLLSMLALASLAAARPVAQTAVPASRPGTAITIERVLDLTPIRAVIARVDLAAPGVRVRCLPAGGPEFGKAPWPTTLETPSAVAAREHLALAVNGDYFMAEQARDAEGAAARTQYVRGKRAAPLGPSVSDGKLWTKGKAGLPMLVVDKDGAVSITEDRDKLDGAREVLSGNRVLVQNGKLQVVHIARETRAPRTAIGLSEDGKTLILAVVDGRSLTSRGMTLGELADFMRKAGAFTAINLDGGGSTAMVQRAGEKQSVLNTPSDGAERPVANVLGIEAP